MTRLGLTALLLTCAVTGLNALAAAPAAPAAPAAAPAADDFKPASTNIVGQQFPKVNSQLQAQFRVQAPNAQKVQILFSNPLDPQTPFDMTKEANGAWTFTSNPMQGGFHYY